MTFSTDDRARDLAAQLATAERALRASEERLRLALEAGQIGSWDWDVVADAMVWSDRVYDQYGLQRDQFGGTGAAYLALVHAQDRARVQLAIDAALGAGESFNVEFRVCHPDGSVVWLTSWAHAYRDAQGVTLRLVGASLDVTASRRAQARLQDMNTLLQQRVDSSNSERDRIWRMSHDVLAVASQSGFLISVNPAFEALLGWSAEQATAMPFRDLVHPEQRGLIARKLDQLAKGEPVADVDIRLLHRDGSERWLAWTLVPEGQLIYGVGRDVTGLRQQRELLARASESRLQLALDVGGMGAWQWNIESGEVVWWPGMDKLHGLAPGTTIGAMDQYMDYVLEADRAALSTQIERALREKTGHHVEYRIVWPDGTVHWIEGRAELAFDSAGQTVQMSGVCVDVSRRKHTEISLRFLAGASAELASLDELPRTLERVANLAVPAFSDWCAVDLLTPDGRLERVAVAHVDPVKAQLGHDLFRRYPPARDAAGGTWQVLRSGQSQLVELIDDAMLAQSISDPEYLSLIRALGLRSYIGVPLTARGKTLGVITFVAAEGGRQYGPEDVTLAEDIGRRAAVAIENAHLYRSLQESDRRKDEFLAMLAHELRNPLAPIRAAGELLRLSADSPHLQKISAVLTRQVGHMTGLVDDLLDVSRVTRGLVELERKPVDMHAVLAAAVEQVRPLIDARQHALTVDIASAALMVEGDEKRLVQILANLLNNAAKYTPSPGAITLSMQTSGEQVEVRVRDNGIGMAPELVASAFELFVQAERSADRSQGGLGLGLGLVRSLAQLHGGTVEASSAGLGRGSEFVVRLPLLR